MMILFQLIMRDEDLLYEDEDIICFTNPYSLGMVAVEKSTIGEYVDKAIKRNPDSCMQKLIDEIKWEILYWNDCFTCDDADAFLVEHGCEPYDWWG